MSDHHTTPDPIDEAYVQAEARLDDEAGRAARRAQVLAAVAREPAAPPAKSAPLVRRPALRRGGWLAAAAVAGLSVALATQLHRQAPLRPQSAPMPVAASSSPHSSAAAARPLQIQRRRHTPPSRTGPVAAAPTIAAARSTPAPDAPLAPRAFPVTPLTTVAPPPLPAPPVKQADARPSLPMLEPVVTQTAPAPPAPAAPPPAETVVAASRHRSATAPAISGAEAAPAQSSAYSAARTSLVRPSDPRADPAARLGLAAAAGRYIDVEALLAQGVPVDATDAVGDTALMKSIRADRPAVAALLLRHGASLDRTNRAGESARDMATAKGDAKLNQALGLEPGAGPPEP